MSDSTTTQSTGPDFAGMQPTGRRIAGGTADLVELDDGADEGLRHTALVFHERYREHDALRTGIEIARGFMEFPMVSGLVELSHWLPEQGTFIYPTGTAWTATEVLRTLRDSGGVTVPSRSILEAAYLSAMILQEASETGPQQGVFAHGSMTPSRVLFKADGQVQIIGYGLPAVDLMMYLEDADNVPNEDTFRYAPPERMAGLAEDGDSDIYTLCLVLWELLSGEPVYDGTIDEMREMAKRGDADKRVTRSAPKQRKVPDGLADLFVRALNPDPDARPTPLEFVQGIEKLMTENPDGVTLEQVMDKVREGSKRGRSLAAPPKGAEAVGGRGRPVGPTSVPKGQLLAAGAGIMSMSIGVVARGPGGPPGAPGAAPPGDVVAPEAGSRWGKPARGGGAKDDGDARDKLRARLRKGDGKDAAPAEAPTGSGSVEDARERLRNRLKGKEDVKAAAPAAEAAAAPIATDDARARLRGRLKPGSAVAPAAEAPAEVVVPTDAAPADAAPTPPADPREALRERLKARSSGGAAEAPASEAKAPEAPAAPAVEAPAPPEVAPAPAAPVDPRAALREKLRQRAGEQPTGTPSAPVPAAPPAAVETAPAAASEAAPAAASVEAPAAAPAPAAEDPREALRRKLRERAQTKE